MSILSSLGIFGESAPATGENIDPNAIPEIPNEGKGGGNDGNDGDDNTTMLLVLGAVAVGGFLLLNK